MSGTAKAMSNWFFISNRVPFCRSFFVKSLPFICRDCFECLKRRFSFWPGGPARRSNGQLLIRTKGRVDLGGEFISSCTGAWAGCLIFNA